MMPVLPQHPIGCAIYERCKGMLNLHAKSGRTHIEGHSAATTVGAVVPAAVAGGRSTAEVAHHHPGGLPGAEEHTRSQNRLNQTSRASRIRRRSRSPVRRSARCALRCMGCCRWRAPAAPDFPGGCGGGDATQAAASSFPWYSSLWSFELFGRPPPVSVVAARLTARPFHFQHT